MIRGNSEIDLHVVRHAEAYKNLEKRHGGGDQRLTPEGERQARRAGRHLLNVEGVRLGEGFVTHQPEGRSEETARRIADVTLRRLRMSPNLKGIDLGSRAGLSEEELAEQYPDVSEAIEAWRTTRVGFEVPEVPGAEPVQEFADRVREGIEEEIELADDGESAVLVGTTSTLIMVNHLLAHDGEYSGPRYEFVEAPLGSVSSWKISSDEAPQLEKSLIVPKENDNG